MTHRNRRPQLPMLALALIFAAVPSIARAATFEDLFALWSSPRSQINLRKQAQCIVQKHEADARRVVVEALMMMAIAKDYPHLLKACFEARLFASDSATMSDAVYQAALAEALVAKLPPQTDWSEAATASPLPRPTIPEMDLTKLPQKVRDAFALGARGLKLDAAQECAIRKVPSEAAALVRSPPDSADEQTLMGKVDARVQTCFSDGSVDPMPVFAKRGQIAWNLYRLLAAAKDPSSVKAPDVF